nr:hypothetical protein [Bacteroides intestinalis]
MIQNIFQYDNMHNRVELNMPEILLVKEFSELVKCERNICKEDPKGIQGLRAFREFTYIWLAIDWKSPYSDFSERERHQEALNDSGITEEEFNNPEFRAACRKYRQLQESNRSIKMLQAAQNTVDNFIDYFNTVVDLSERDANGKPVFKTKDIISEISSLSKVHEELKILEGQVKKEMMETTSIRGGATDGFLPNF